MVKRKTSSARVSNDALEMLSILRKDSGLTSAEVIDNALKAYGNKSLTKALEVMFDKATPNKGKLDKDDPAIRNAVKVAKESGWELDDISIKFESPQDFTEFFNKLKKEHRAEFTKSIQESPSYLKLDNTKPPNAVLDACILSLWGKRGIEQIEEAVPAPDYEDYLVPRVYIMRWVKAQLIKPIDGISWPEFHKTWYDTHNTYKGKFERTIDNRIKALMRAKIIKHSVERGQYILYRDLTDDENIIIEGILRLQPQKGIVIPTII